MNKTVDLLYTVVLSILVSNEVIHYHCPWLRIAGLSRRDDFEEIYLVFVASPTISYLSWHLAFTIVASHLVKFMNTCSQKLQTTNLEINMNLNWSFFSPGITGTDHINWATSVDVLGLHLPQGEFNQILGMSFDHPVEMLQDSVIWDCAIFVCNFLRILVRSLTEMESFKSQ